MTDLNPVRGKDSSHSHLSLTLEMAEGGPNSPWAIKEVAAAHKANVALSGPAYQRPPAPVNSEAGTLPPPPQEGGAAEAEEGQQGTEFVDAFIACLRTDRDDGLYTTVVCDRQGIAIGLVYSNTESIRASVGAFRGVYWSRSRNGLWRKGDTSGAWQDLFAIDVDCDSDALRFTVHQHGNPAAFCHRNDR